VRRAINILFDARCLQDDNYRDRGVGRHSINIVRSARQLLAPSADARLIAIADARMAPLASEDAEVFDYVKPTAYPAALQGSTWFVGLSPMTHDPLFVARALGDARIFKACVVYDFIPFHERNHYLPSPRLCAAYGLSMYWLAQHDLFLPISRSSANDLRNLLWIPEERIAVTGVPIDPAFERTGGPSIRPFPAGHILAVGGGDPRKNVECAISAHGRSRHMQAQRIGLVITGHYPEPWSSELVAVASAAGGDPDLVHFPGRVPEEMLVNLYRSALCVIVPSRAEGFSLPVVEAMAAGTPVIASSIPAHRELITHDDLLFASEDDTAASRLLDRFVFDGNFRRQAIESQSRVWRRFRGGAVAATFWSKMVEHATADRVGTPRAIIPHHRPKIAFLTPLPPDKSGVADYSAASLREIAKLAEVHVFTETVEPRPIDHVASIRPLSALPHISAEYDRVVGVVGNSHYHLKIFDYLVRYGGACIEHDNRLLGFYVALLGEARATKQAERELGRTLRPGELHDWWKDESDLKTLFLGELARTCEPLCLHSRVTARLVQERYGGAPIVLPFSIYREMPSDARTPAARRRARAALGIAEDEVVIVTFGFVHSTKAPNECIWALDMLRSWGIAATLHFVGTSGPVESLVGLCQRLHIEPYVKFFGDYVPNDLFQTYLAAADYGIQLRKFSLGALSGALLDCIACGLPTIANEALAEVMDSPAYVARVPDNPSPVLIAEAIANLMERNPHRHGFEEERRAYEDTHNMRVYARYLMEALRL